MHHSGPKPALELISGIVWTWPHYCREHPQVAHFNANAALGGTKGAYICQIRVVPGAGLLEDFLLSGLNAGSKRYMLAKFGAKVRPESVSVETSELYAQLSPVCAEINVKCVIDHDPSSVKDFMRGLEQAMNTGSGRQSIPSILGGAGVTIPVAKELWRTCAAFYRAEPWRRMWNDDLVEARYPETGRPFLICVMGNGGAQFGVALFDDLAHFEGASDERNQASKKYFGVTIDDAREVSFLDIDTAEALGWDRISAELAPQLICKRKQQLVAPDLNEVLLPGLHGGAKIALRFPASGGVYSLDKRLGPDM